MYNCHLKAKSFLISRVKVTEIRFNISFKNQIQFLLMINNQLRKQWCLQTVVYILNNHADMDPVAKETADSAMDYANTFRLSTPFRSGTLPECSFRTFFDTLSLGQRNSNAITVVDDISVTFSDRFVIAAWLRRCTVLDDCFNFYECA